MLAVGGGSGLRIRDIPKGHEFDNKKFKLKATIGGDHEHFVAFIKRSTYWLFYDGMARPTMMEQFANSK